MANRSNINGVRTVDKTSIPDNINPNKQEFKVTKLLKVSLYSEQFDLLKQDFELSTAFMTNIYNYTAEYNRASLNPDRMMGRMQQHKLTKRYHKLSQEGIKSLVKYSCVNARLYRTNNIDLAEFKNRCRCLMAYSEDVIYDPIDQTITINGLRPGTSHTIPVDGCPENLHTLRITKSNSSGFDITLVGSEYRDVRAPASNPTSADDIKTDLADLFG